MGSSLTKSQVEDLLVNVLDVADIRDWKGDKIQFCCPVHGETHPSCGINIDYCPDDQPNAHYQVFHCFSCHEGGSIPWLLYKSKPEVYRSVKQAEDFLKDKYGVDYSHMRRTNAIKSLRRYEDQFVNLEKVDRFEMPMAKLALYKSGKETYQYFFDRGFDKQDMMDYMIGRDLDSKTVTMPVFWEDGALAGLIGRYISKNRPKNMRFKIYEFPKGKLIFPLDKVQAIDDTLIGVESQIDCMLMRKWGFTNCISTMGDGMSKEQADQISSRCRKFIGLWDNDQGGKTADELARKRLGKRVMYLSPTYYPNFGKDPDEWGAEEVKKIVQSASMVSARNIPRL